MDGHCLGSFWPAWCPACQQKVHGIMFSICDDPYTEAVECGTCHRVLSMTGGRVDDAAAVPDPDPAEETLQFDGEGRR